jgi:membrane associated rhomboid family serine protease
MDDSIRDGLLCVASFPRLRQADERALVIAAMGLPYWIFHQEDHYELCVEEAFFQQAREELARFELERRQYPFRRLRHFGQGARRAPAVSLFIVAWIMAGFFLIQQTGPKWLAASGNLSPESIFERGEWWRLVTALTLHADLSHIGANLATGIVFAAFLLPMFGTGFTWSAILLSGVLGNLLNSLFYRGESHYSIGSSTAVFGALGILVGAQIAAQTIASRQLRIWEIILPIGAGAALLAYLGAGDKNQPVDFMAHFWGFTAGIPIGALGEFCRVRKRLPKAFQRVLAASAALFPWLCWGLAFIHKR